MAAFESEWEKNLIQFRVEKAPPKVFYIPNFITEDEEKELLNRINTAPKPKWTQLANRRLQNWGGLPHPKGMVPEKLPQWLSKYTSRLDEMGVFDKKKVNHVLVNEYEPNQGIMPHVDGPLFYPVISTINLGSHTMLDFYHPLNKPTNTDENSREEQAVLSHSLQDRHVMSLLLQPCSLLILKDEMYTSYLHGIDTRTDDLVTDKVINIESCEGVGIGDHLKRDTRVSMTIRNVPKVLNFKMKLGK